MRHSTDKVENMLHYYGDVNSPSALRSALLRNCARNWNAGTLSFHRLESINKKLASHIIKYNGYFGRLCVIWHCIEHAFDKRLPVIVSLDTAQRVAHFLHDFLLPHAVAFYSGVLGLADEHERIANVAGFILAHKLEPSPTVMCSAATAACAILTRQDTEQYSNSSKRSAG